MANTDYEKLTQEEIDTYVLERTENKKTEYQRDLMQTVTEAQKNLEAVDMSLFLSDAIRMFAMYNTASISNIEKSKR